MKRRNFFQKGIWLIPGIYLFPEVLRSAQSEYAKPVTQEPEKKLNSELVYEFVLNCHSNLEIVIELEKEEPGLIFASHDWGKGDFENGIEAAGHMGNKKIADFLISKGARINFFTLCMLGKIETVRRILEDFPGMLNSKGPHGFTPLHHANKGGEDAAKVKELLLSLGAVETKITL